MSIEQRGDSTPAKAIAYCRLASGTANGIDAALEEQAQRCRGYARSIDCEVVAIFSDHGGGQHLDRPGLGSMLTYLRTHSAGSPIRVILENSSRLARDTESYFELRRAITDAGGTIEIAELQFERSTPSHADTAPARQRHLRRQP